MITEKNINIEGVPENITDVDAAVFRSRLHRAVSEMLKETKLEKVNIRISNSEEKEKPEQQSQQFNGDSPEFDTNKRAARYISKDPLWRMGQLIIDEVVMEKLTLALDTLRHRKTVFEDWGLCKIEPFPRGSLNFFGEPGTGKTLAAHAAADELGMKILEASYAGIESMYHGEGPKNVEALFYAAQRDNAVLFIDEADSLLSKRLTSVTQGSEQAINSMRSQLLLCLERFSGIVIFATNLAENYDKAFDTRIKHVHFPMPNENARLKIWESHLPESLPLDDCVDISELAKSRDNICGRDIKNAVINASVQAARSQRLKVRQADFMEAIDDILETRERLRGTDIKPKPLDESERNKLSRRIKNLIKK